MTGSLIIFEGVYGIRESDKHPIITATDGSVWLISGSSDPIIENMKIKEGDKVMFRCRKSWVGFPIKEQAKYDKDTSPYCNLLCPTCGGCWS